MMGNFYTVDLNYIEFLQYTEEKKRGKTCVPNLKVEEGKKPKFLYGPVGRFNGMDYYVPVSSYAVKQPDTFLLFNQFREPISSLRFAFMIPVPQEFLKEHRIDAFKDEPKYRSYLGHQLRHCINHHDDIKRIAIRTYSYIMSGKDPSSVERSCAFGLLETAANIYVKYPEKVASIGGKIQAAEEARVPLERNESARHRARWGQEENVAEQTEEKVTEAVTAQPAVDEKPVETVIEKTVETTVVHAAEVPETKVNTPLTPGDVSLMMSVYVSASERGWAEDQIRDVLEPFGLEDRFAEEKDKLQAMFGALIGDVTKEPVAQAKEVVPEAKEENKVVNIDLPADAEKVVLSWEAYRLLKPAPSIEINPLVEVNLNGVNIPNLPIETLYFRSGAGRILQNAGIIGLPELAGLSLDKLQSIPYMTPERLLAINNVMVAYGLPDLIKGNPKWQRERVPVGDEPAEKAAQVSDRKPSFLELMGSAQKEHDEKVAAGMGKGKGIGEDSR